MRGCAAIGLALRMHGPAVPVFEREKSRKLQSDVVRESVQWAIQHVRQPREERTRQLYDILFKGTLTFANRRVRSMSDLGASPTGGSLGFLQDLDGDRDGQFNLMGRNLVNALFVLLRSAGVCTDLNNDALIRPTQGMIDACLRVMKAFHEEASIQLVDGTFFVNKRLLRLDFSTFQNARYLRRIFEFLAVNELTFTQAVDKSTLHSFLLAFLKVVRERQGAINDYPLGSIRLRKVDVVSEDIGETVEEPRVQVLNINASGLLMLRSFVNDLRRGNLLGISGSSVCAWTSSDAEPAVPQPVAGTPASGELQGQPVLPHAEHGGPGHRFRSASGAHAESARTWAWRRSTTTSAGARGHAGPAGHG